MKNKKTTTQRGYGYKWRKKCELVFKIKGKYCHHCGSEENIQVHHILAKSKGGTDHINNLVPVCFRHHKLLTAQERKNKSRLYY